MYKFDFNSVIIPQTFSIVHLVMLNVLVACRVFKTVWRKKCIQVKCNNLAVVQVLSSGATRDPYLAAMARNIWLVTTLHECKLTVTHIPGKQNIVADVLSRWRGTDRDVQLLKENVIHHVWCDVVPQFLYINTEI